MVASGLRILLLLFFVASFARADFIHSISVGGVAYFANTAPAEIARYDLAARQWLSPLGLPAGRGVPTAVCVDADGVYVAYAKAVYRYALDGSAETFLLNTATNVTQIVTNTTHIYLNLTTAEITSVAKATNTLFESKTYQYYVMSGLAMAPDGSAIYARTPNVSPSDIHRIPIAANGAQGTRTESPYHGDYPSASTVWVFPDGARVVDTSGTVYRTTDLQYTASFNSMISDLKFLGSEPIVLRNNRLLSYTSDLLPAKSLTLAYAPKYLFLNGGDAVTFTADATQISQLRADIVPLVSLTAPVTAPPVEPLGVQFTPDDIVLDQDGILYLLAKDQRSLFRWDTSTQRYLETIPLLGSPNAIVYASVSDRIYLAYPDGVIRFIDLASGSFGEELLVTISKILETDSPTYTIPPKLVAVGDYLYLQTSWPSRHLIFDRGGNQVSSVDRSPGSGVVWNQTAQKIYYSGVSTVSAEQVNESGAAYPGLPAGGIGTVQSASHGDADYFENRLVHLSPDGSAFIYGPGKVFATTNLSRLGTLGNTVTDSAWLNGSIYSIRTISNAIQIQQWNGTNYSFIKLKQGQGTAHRLFALPSSRLLAVTMQDSKPSFDIYDAALDVVLPPVWDGPAWLTGQVSSANAVTLKWEDGPAESKYVVERRTLPGGTWEFLADIYGATTLVDTQLPVGSAWEYRVSAVNGNTSSAYSTVQVNYEVPPAPETLDATVNGATKILLEWSSVPEAVSYKVENLGSDGVWRPIATPTETSYQVLSLTTGHEYTYRVSAVNAVGSSLPSPVATAMLNLIVPAQYDFAITSYSAWEVTLQWSNYGNPGGAPAFYVLERRANTESPWQVIAQPTTARNTDTDVAPQTTYQYRVKAVNAAGSSPYSEIKTVTTSAVAILAAPTGLVARSASATSVRLSWANSSRETGYRIERSSSGVAWALVGTTGPDETTYVDPGLVTGRSYTYRVSATNTVGSSNPSATDSATPVETVVWMEDNFDLGWKPMWSTVNGAQSVDGGTGFRGSSALWFGLGGARTAITIPVDVSSGGVLEFLFRAGNAARDGAEYWDDAEANEGVVIEYSPPTGGWYNLTSLATLPPSYGDWTPVVLKIPAGAVGKSTRFRWRQLAHDGTGADSWALEDVRFSGPPPAIPAAPALIIGQANGPTSASLIWALSAGATSYTVQRLDAEQWGTVGTFGAETTATAVSGLLPNNRYYFRVLAANLTGQSAASPQAAIETWGGGEDPEEGSVSFLTQRISVRETPGGGSATLTVARAGANAAPVTVDYTFTAGTATAGSDFVAQGGSLSFGAGETTATIPISLMADSTAEPDEDFMVQLHNVTGAGLGAVTSLTITIQDDDAAGTLAFASGTSIVNENAGTATLAVKRTEGTRGTVSVGYTLAGGSAQAGDYAFTPGTLEFADGEVEKTISVSLLNDSVAESLETIIVELSSPTGGAALGSLVRHTISIQDEDAFAFAAASYAGLLHRANVAAPEGLIRFTSTARGSVTGTVRTGRTSRTFSGRFTPTGELQAKVGPLPAGSAAGARNLVLNLNPSGIGFTATFTDATSASFASEGARLVRVEESSPKVLNQSFSGLVRDEASSGAVRGVGSLAVSRSAAVSLRGYAPNTRAMVSSAYLTVDGQILASALPAGGTLYGALDAGTNAADGVSFAGHLWWQPTPAQGASPVAPTEFELTLHPYDKALNAQTVFADTPLGFRLSISGDGQPPVPVNWASFMTLSGTGNGSVKIRLKLNRSLGTFLGSRTVPGQPTLKLYGALVQIPEDDLPSPGGFTSDAARAWVVTSEAP